MAAPHWGGEAADIKWRPNAPVVGKSSREREAYEDSLAIVRQFNARLSAKKTAWFWPTVGAALVSMHHWLVIA